MIRSVLFVTFILVASCANYKDAASPGYPHCAWQKTECRRSTECCSDWCVNGFCEMRDD